MPTVSRPVTAPALDTYALAGRLVARHDRDADAKLSRRELRAFEDVFTRLDANGDTVVEQVELSRALARSPEAAARLDALIQRRELFTLFGAGGAVSFISSLMGLGVAAFGGSNPIGMLALAGLALGAAGMVAWFFGPRGSAIEATTRAAF